MNALAAWLTARIDPVVYGLMRLFFGVAAVCKFTGFYSVIPRMIKGDFHFGLPLHRYTSVNFAPGILQGEWIAAPSYAAYFHVEEAALVAAVFVVVGAGARLATAVLSLCCFWLLLVDPGGFKHNLFAIACFGILIAASPCGDRVSVDAWLRRLAARRGLVSAAPALRSAFVLRLVQAQVAVLYLFSTLVKVSDGWWSGHLLYYGVDEAVARLRAMGFGALEPLVRFRPFYVASAWAIVVLEALLVVGFFMPRFRRATIVLGIALHVGIDLSVDVGSYSLTMYALYIAFIDERPRHLRVRAPARTARAIRALDWLARCEVVVDDGVAGVVAVDRGAGGVDVDALAVWERLPLTFLPATAVRLWRMFRAWRARGRAAP
jgi:hypothetical protein